MFQLARPFVARCRRGFTLVELLVVITLIGILVGLTLPAVQNARETGRKAFCANNLRQMGLAVQQHLATHKIFPSGGWGYDRVGDPDLGYRKKQPGSWIYNLLPFLDNVALHNLGAGGTNEIKARAATVLVDTPLPIMNCPSLHRAANYPLAEAPKFIDISTWDGKGAKTDYAINAGSQELSPILGNSDAVAVESTDATWITRNHPTHQYYCSGVSFQWSEVTSEDVRDGLSSTLLIGEKFVDFDNRNGEPENMSSGGKDTSIGNNRSMYAGYCYSNYRTTYNRSLLRTSTGQYVFPSPANPVTGDTITRAPLHIASVSDLENSLRGKADAHFYYSSFGGSHPASCNFVFCDGAVHAISYTVDWRIFACMGHRCDGNSYDMSALDGATGEWLNETWWSK